MSDESDATLRITCDLTRSQPADSSDDSDPIRSLTLAVNSNGPSTSIYAATHIGLAIPK